jgi:hypothetical protein
LIFVFPPELPLEVLPLDLAAPDRLTVDLVPPVSFDPEDVFPFEPFFTLLLDLFCSCLFVITDLPDG